MKEKRVAFQGVPGAYSELAAVQHFGSGVRAVPCPEFADVFRAVLAGKVDYGMVPIENSLTGSIHQNFDLLLKHRVWIVGETKLRVSHSLIAPTGTTLKTLEEVYSHPQALQQCARFLRSLKKVRAIPYFDTAGSVKFVAESKTPGIAAIASKEAAARYGLKVLRTAIEDNPHNFTRFLVISRKEGKARAKRFKTSLVFDLRSVPGALHLALGTFAELGIQLFKIESRPIPGHPWEYLFYLDFEGHHAEPAPRAALERLEAMATFTKVLGSYPA